VKKSLPVSISVIISITLVWAIPLVECQTDVVSIKIQDANDATSSAFAEISKAELCGADITELITELNIALNLLVQADNAYRTGDNQLSLNSATSASIKAQQVIVEAKNAQETAALEQHKSTLYAVAFAVVGSVVVIIALFICWRLVKKRYISNMLESKPEVSGN